jgi:hypothetical protein
LAPRITHPTDETDILGWAGYRILRALLGRRRDGQA